MPKVIYAQSCVFLCLVGAVQSGVLIHVINSYAPSYDCASASEAILKVIGPQTPVGLSQRCPDVDTVVLTLSRFWTNQLCYLSQMNWYKHNKARAVNIYRSGIYHNAVSLVTFQYYCFKYQHRVGRKQNHMLNHRTSDWVGFWNW